MISQTEIHNQFRGLGLKITLPRVIIFESLQKFSHHPSAEDVYKSLQKKYPTISLATVYKTLDLLVQNNLATKVVTNEDKVRYDHRIEEHIHLYCEKTSTIVDYEDPKLQKLLSDYFKNETINGFEIKQIQINIKGISSTIKKQNK
ncbi:MAG: Fur family transcriptional regulator [bacterium]|nr:Fur family transcriptional regulator [bacterium]